MSIEEAFQDKVISLGTAAGSRVFREVIEQEPVLPAISVVRTGASPLQRDVSTGKTVLDRASIRVEIIVDTSADADALSAALKDGLDGWRGTQSGVTVLHCGLVFQGDASVVDGDRFIRIVQQDYELTYR